MDTPTSSQQPPPHKRILADVYISLMAGALAGACAKTTIAPLDRVKINFQTSVHMPFTFGNAVRYMLRQVKAEGVTSLWRGNSATMVRIIPYAAIQFTAHEQWKRVLGVGKNPLKSPKWQRLLAGSLAGVTASSLTYPLDVARARMAVTPRSHYSSLFAVFRAMRRDGIAHGVYRGLTPTLIGSACYGGSSFFTYETLKNHYKQQLEDEHATKQQQNPNFNAPQRKIKPYESLAFGAAAGIIGQSCSYPLDIVRRRMQTSSELPVEQPKPNRLSPSANMPNNFAVPINNSSTRSNRSLPPRGGNFFLLRALVHIAREEGIVHGLYKGLSLNWIKGPTAVGISFTVYDHLSEWLRNLEDRVEDVIIRHNEHNHFYWPATAAAAAASTTTTAINSGDEGKRPQKQK